MQVDARRPRRGPRARPAGFTLGSTLVLLAVAMTVAFTLAALAFFQMNVNTRMHAFMLAENAAESAIQMAIAQEMTSNAGFGSLPTDRVQFQDEHGAVGIVTFSTSEVRDHVPLAHSTYNFDKNGAATTRQGYRARLVPRNGMHLVGNGFYGDVVKRIECILHFPNYPYAVGSNGVLRCSHAVIAAVKSDADIVYNPDGSVAVSDDNLSQGNVVSNSPSDQAMLLDAATSVTGDAQAVGKVVLAAQSTVQGEVRSEAEAAPIPTLDIDAYDPSQNAFCQYLPASMDGTTLEGYGLAQADLVIEGDMTLNNGLLFVKGNLTLNGGLLGNGAVFVKGTTTITGPTRVAGSQGVALFSNGDVTLSGNSSTTNFLQGLFYTNGKIDAARITVLGSLIQNQPAASGGSTKITDARIIFAPGKVVPSVFRPVEMLTLNCEDTDFATMLERWRQGVHSDPTTLPPTLPAKIPPVLSSNVSLLGADPDRIAKLPLPYRVACLDEDNSPILTGKDDITRWCFSQYCLSVVLRDNRLVLVHRQQSRWDGAGHGYDGNSGLERDLLAGSPWTTYPQDNGSLPAGYISIYEFLGPAIRSDGTPDPTELSTFIDSYVNGRAINIQYMNQEFGWNWSTTKLHDAVQNLFAQALERPSRRIPPGCNFQYDPNQYLSPADRLRVLLWKDIEE